MWGSPGRDPALPAHRLQLQGAEATGGGGGGEGGGGEGGGGSAAAAAGEGAAGEGAPGGTLKRWESSGKTSFRSEAPLPVS